MAAPHPFIEEITSAPKWKDADEKTRRESVRQFAIASKAEGMDPAERGVILDGLYDAAGAKGAMGWLVNAAKEGLKSIPAGAAAVVGAAAELSGAANDTGAETRLGQGVEDMLDSGVQRVKSMAPGDWQEKRDAAFAAFKQDLDTGAYPPEFGTLMSMSMDEQSGRGAEFKPAFDYLNGWQEVLMHANILADRGPTTGEKNNLSPARLENFKRAGQGIYDHRLQEFIADYMATRDPAAWGVIESIGKETETSYEIRKTQEKEAWRYADFDPENSLLDDLSLRAAGFQRSPIDMAMTVFPLLRGAKALQAARSTGLAAGLKHAAGAAAGEFVSGAASEALSAGGTASAGQVAEAGAMEAVGGGMMAGGSAVAGKAMQLLPGKRTAGAQSSPSVDTTQGAPATPAAGAAQTEEAASAPAPVEPVEALTDPDFDGTLLSELLPAGEMGSDGGMEGMSDGEMGSEGPSSPLLPDQESAPAPTPSEGASALEQAFRMAAARGQSPAVESAPPTLEATPEMLRFAAEGAFRDAGADIQPGTADSPPVPDTAETVAEQARLAAEKGSSRKAVLITPGTPKPPKTPGLKPLQTPHGLVLYNPAKISAAEVQAAGAGEVFDARVLGMSGETQGSRLKAETGPALAVTASTPAAPNVQAELVTDPAALPAAIAAAEAAAPGAAVEVKPANQVLTERAAGATSGALPDAAATNQRAKEKAGQPPALAAGKPAAKAPAVKRNQFKPDVRRYPVASQLAIAPQNPARQLAKWRKQQKGSLEGALTTGDRKLSKERGEYNDLPTIGEFQGRPIAQDALRRIYRNGNTLSPDKAFKQVGIEDLEQGIAQLRAELRSMDTIAREEKAQATQERQGEAFYMAISDGPVALHSSQLKKGDVLNIEGEEARVIQVKYDEGEWTPSKVVLEDGRKFGRQTLDGDTALFVEGYEPASAAGFGLEAQTDAQIEQERQTAADRARTAAARQAMQDRAAAPLTGRDTTGQGALFANDPANDLFSGPSAEEMPFSKRTPGKRVTAADWVPALGQLERNAPELVQNLRVVTRAADLSPADFTADQWQSILEHRPEGFFHARNDGVVVILDNLQRRPGETGGQAMTRVVQHEQLGHRGLRVALKNAWFRRDWEALAKMVPQSELDAVAKDYPDLAGDRMALVEEWFARHAGEAATAPRGSLLRRMYDAFKEWVARVWRNIAGDQRTLEQRTQDAIKASRRALESRASSGGDSLLMSRAPGADPADAIPAVPPGMDINRYGQRVQADERLREEWRAQFTPALYKTFGEAELSKRVAAWIGREGGLEQGAALFLDAASGLADYERNALGQQVAIGLDQRARRAAAAGDAKATHATESLFDDVIGVLEVLATQAGQALRSFGMWARFSPRGIVRTFERAVEKTRTTQAAKALGVDAAEMPAVMEEAAAAVKAAHTRTTAERKARTTDIAQKWIQRLATVQSDTLSWRTAPKLSELERLIREHMRAPVADFDARVQALGVDPHSAGVLDRLVMEDHRRRPAIDRAAEQEAFIKSLLPRAPRAARAKIPAFVEAIFKAARHGVLTRSDFLDAYAEKFGHPRFTPEFAAAIRQQVDAVQSMPEGSWLRQREQSRLMSLLAQHEGLSTRDIFTSFWYANILSGAGTHLVNITGNATHLLLRTMQVALTSRPQDTIAFVRGMLHGAAQGRIQAAAAFKNGEPVMRGDEEWQKMDVLELLWSENPDTWSGKLAKYGAASWGRYIFRALTAADAFFWNSAKEGRAWLETSRRLAKGDNLQTALGLDAPQWAAAQEQAAEELKAAGRGSRTADIDRRAMEIVEAGREADITHEARKWAAHATYNYDSEGTMGVFAAGMNLITKHFPPARAVVPFVRIVANMTDVNLDWTPIGLLRAAKGSHLWNMKSSGGRIVAGEKFSPRDRAERAIAGAVGTLALGALYTMALAYADDDDERVPFMLYGMGPSDPGRRKQMPKGWKPYSMKIGDYYVSFEGTPLAFAMSMVGTALDKRRYASRPGDDSRLWSLMVAGPKAMMNSGFLSSLKDSFDMLSGDRKPGVWAERTAAGLIPAASFLKDVATALDPVEVDQTRFGATFLSYLPVLRGEQQPRLNVFGEPVETPGPWLIQRIVRRAEKQDAQASWLTQRGLHIPDLDNDVRVGQWLEKRDKPRSAGGLQADRAFRAETLARLSNGDLTPQERTAFLRTTGPQIRKAITILEQRARAGAKIDQNDVTTAVSRIRRAAMKGLVK